MLPHVDSRGGVGAEQEVPAGHAARGVQVCLAGGYGANLLNRRARLQLIFALARAVRPQRLVCTMQGSQCTRCHMAMMGFKIQQAWAGGYAAFCTPMRKVRRMKRRGATTRRRMVAHLFRSATRTACRAQGLELRHLKT